MSQPTVSPDASCLLGEVATLITDDVGTAIDRMIQLASGELIPTPGATPIPGSLSRRAVSEDAARRDTQHPIPHSRVYLRPPHQSSVEYIIDRALGIPGAEIDCYETTLSASERLQAAKDREAGVDYSPLLINSDKQFKDALPMAIDRLIELAEGITVQRTRWGKPYTITRKPNCRAIEYIADRIAGKSGSILSALQDRFENPDTNRKYTSDEIAAMSDAEKLILREALARKHEQDKKSGRPSAYNDTDRDDDEDDVNTIESADPAKLPSNSPPSSPNANDSLVTNSPPSPACGRGIEGEGYPPHILSANKTLIAFLPTAIKHIKTLACGAQTIIETETERKVFTHEPDYRANSFLINRFMGAPAGYLPIVRIVDKTETQKKIDQLCAKYPQVIARYGSLQAVIDAYNAAHNK